MYLCLISTHELLLPAAITRPPPPPVIWGVPMRKKGVNIKFIPILFLLTSFVLSRRLY